MQCTLRTLVQVQSGYPQSYRHGIIHGKVAKWSHCESQDTPLQEHVSDDIESEILIDAPPSVLSLPVTNSPTDTDSPDLTKNVT